jgi:hypothetical protein
MPATAGRVKMPANNRQSTSGALKTNAIWQQVVGYDPYKGASEGSAAASESKKVSAEQAAQAGYAYRDCLQDGVVTEEMRRRGEGLLEMAKLHKAEGLGASSLATRAASSATSSATILSGKRNRLTFEAAATMGWRPADGSEFGAELSDRALDAAVAMVDARDGDVSELLRPPVSGSEEARHRRPDDDDDSRHRRHHRGRDEDRGHDHRRRRRHHRGEDDEGGERHRHRHRHRDRDHRSEEPSRGEIH